jgi:flagellar biosynthesis GTPase FlhF
MSADTNGKTPVEIIAAAHGIDPEEIRPKAPRISNLWIFTFPVWSVKAIYNAPTTYRDYVERQKEMKEFEAAQAQALAAEEAERAAEQEERRLEDEARRKRDEDRKANRRMKAQLAEEEARKRREEMKNGQTDSFGGRAASFNSKAVEDSDTDGTGDGSTTDGMTGPRQRRPGGEGEDGAPKANQTPTKKVNTSPNWTTVELSKLSQLTKKFPGGTAGRWVRIAGELNREVDAVVDMARKLNENPRLATEGYIASNT